LAGAGDTEPPALDLESSTFRFVGSLAFHIGSGMSAPEADAATVGDWLRQLRDRQARRLWLFVAAPKPTQGAAPPAEEHQLVGFANAGRWFLLVTGGRLCEIWRASWTVGDRNAPAQRIWSVRYGGAYAEPTTTPPRPDVESATGRLAAVLRQARAFAKRQGLDSWAGWFERALDVGDDAPFHGDMLPPGYPSAARHLTAMAAQAWVFGGMGSWNDLSFEDQTAATEYETISRNLYRAIQVALVASVNTHLASETGAERPM